MKFSISLFLTSIVVVINACSPEEPIIDNSKREYRMLLVSATGILAVARMPEATIISENVLATALAVTDIPAVLAVKHYRDDVYVLLRDSAYIIVLDAGTLAFKSRIDLGVSGPASDLVFPNASSAYALHPTTNVLSVIDITVGTVVSTVPTGQGPLAGAVYGNSIGIVCQGSERLDVVDSRSSTVVASVPLPDAPAFIDVDVKSQSFVIASLGAGRIDRRPTNTPQLAFVNVADHSLLGTIDLTNREADGPIQRIGGLVVLPEQFGYVPTSTALLRTNTRTRARATAVRLELYHAIARNTQRNEVVLMRADSTTIEVFDAFVESKQAGIIAPWATRQFLPLPPP